MRDGVIWLDPNEHLNCSMSIKTAVIATDSKCYPVHNRCLSVNKMLIQISLADIAFYEPLWSYSEVEKFWSIIESYIKELLTRSSLPLHSMDFTHLNTQSLQDYKQCLKCLHDGLWSGRYSESVANMRATREFFGRRIHPYERQDGESGRGICFKDELQAMKDIFCNQLVFTWDKLKS